MYRGLPFILGALAVLVTAAALCIQAVIASQTLPSAAAHTTSILAVILDTATLSLVAWLSLSHSSSLRLSARSCPGVSNAVTLAAAIASTVVSAVTLVKLGEIELTAGKARPGVSEPAFVAGAGACFAVSLICQLSFLVFNLLSSQDTSSSSNKLGKSIKPSPRGIRYSQTLMPAVLGPVSGDEEKAMGVTVVGKSSTETLSSPRSSISHVVKPMSSRTRLLSVREKRRPASIDSEHHRISVEDGFETWDTTTVDAAYRQPAIDVTSVQILAAPRYLETIPASPVISHRPSLESVTTLEPPCAAHFSRSSSPSSLRHTHSSLSMHGSTSELHIHPLFRTDSPDPPPMTTPGTSVVAAPNAGQIINHKQSVRSIRSMQRMRSGSLATVATGPSPLSRQSSFDDGASRWTMEERRRPSADHSADERRSVQKDTTPPIPEWDLEAEPSAGPV